MDSSTLTQIQAAREKITPYVVETPVWHWHNREITEVIGPETEIFLKLELFQHTGTFKPRGALLNMLDMNQEGLDRGVTAVSAGNHAIAVAYAAQQLGSSAKVVMISTANPARMAACKAYGAEVELIDGAHEAFERVHQIEAEEGRTFIHPFEGPLTALGTATVGLELCQQVPDLDAVIVPSTAMQEVLKFYGVNTYTEVLPTGIELEKFQNGDGNRFRKNYGIPLDRPTLVFIGRVAFEKNIDFLLHVVDKVRHTIPNVLLLIAGEGPSLHHLKKMAEKLRLGDNVLFLGYLDRNRELLDCYASGDAFVFASNTETQGLVLLEAMALGVPVVSTAVMGTKDILAPKKGALVCNESIDEFSQGIITLLRDKQLRNKLSREALEYVKTWSAPSMAKKLVNFYEHIIHSQ